MRIGGHEIYNFSSLYPTDATDQFGNKDPVINRQCMMHDGAIGQLSDFGNLKKIILFCDVYWFKAYKHNKYTCIYISILKLLIGEYW